MPFAAAARAAVFIPCCCWFSRQARRRQPTHCSGRPPACPSMTRCRRCWNMPADRSPGPAPSAIFKMDGVFVLAIDGELFVKRIQCRVPDKALIVISGNQQYESVVIENGDRQTQSILGRAVWA
ncbi:MAG: S24 family peptidase [Chromatiales bacterium]|nr:S24 family peptidase [Chromatiales bacterium]